MAATLSGNVDLTLLDPVNLVVRFFTPGTDTEVMKACSPTDASGNFTIYGITPGTYDVGVKSDNSLSLLAEGEEFTEGETTEISFGVLKRGDITNDDYVAELDNSLISLYWHQWGPCYGYAGNWLMPPCPGGAPPPGGACYGYVIS